MIEYTLAIIKPDAVESNVFGNIIQKIIDSGFKIVGMKLITISKEQAGAFYLVHKEQPFYSELVNYMSSGAIIPLALQKDNAVDDFRKIIGNTDPLLAEDGTIRKLYGQSKAINAIHGSDSVENAIKEIGFFFSFNEIVANQ